jgi:hypothetical protein
LNVYQRLTKGCLRLQLLLTLCFAAAIVLVIMIFICK